MKTHVIFLGGVPGAGKSTWVQENKKAEHKLVVFDDFVREEKRKKPTCSSFEISKTALEKAWTQVLLFCQEPNTIIFDAPNLTKNQRKPFLNQLKKIHVSFSGIWKDVPFHIALQRNEKREFPISLENQIVFHCLAQAFETSEGFSEIQKDPVPSFPESSKEVQKFLKNSKNYKALLQFPEIAIANHTFQFFHVSFASLLQDSSKTPQERLKPLYQHLLSFYFESFHFNPYAIFARSQESLKQNFLQRIAACRLGNDVTKTFLS